MFFGGDSPNILTTDGDGNVTVRYSGYDITSIPTTIPTEQTLAEGETIKPSYATPPVPKVVTPATAGAPGARVFDLTVREGMRVDAGDLKRYSTGKVRPSLIAGWQNPDNARQSDNRYATTNGQPAGTYSAPLVLSGFDFNLPEGAIITGIKVTVERSKI